MASNDSTPTFASAARQVLKEKTRKQLANIATSVLGSGVLGTTAKKILNKKLARQKTTEATDRANMALAGAQQDTDSTLLRMESIVMNIADNIYNIAGILGAQLTSMKETQKEAAFQRSIARAQLEENISESGATGVAKETVAARSTGDKKQGIIGKLLASFKQTRGSLGKLAKRVGIIGGGLLMLAGPLSKAVAGFSKLHDVNVTPEEALQANNDIVDAELQTQQTGSEGSDLVPDSTSPEVQIKPLVPSTAGSGVSSLEYTKTDPRRLDIPQSVTTENTPILAPETTQSNAAPVPEPMSVQRPGVEMYPQNNAAATQLPAPQLVQLSAPLTLSQQNAAAEASTTSVPPSVTSSSKTPAGASTSPEQTYSFSATPPAATPIESTAPELSIPAPATGNNIDQASRDVQIARIRPAGGGSPTTSVQTNTIGNDSKEGEGLPIPSPIADRGSLDTSVFFKA
jgi:hypothetical protein